MNRLFWGITLLVAVTAGGWAQSTWRGQAEVWSTADAPTDGFVAASNQFPRNSLLSVENYKSRKTIQVRVVSGLPSGSTALVLLNSRAAQALDIKPGDIPLVGVRLDPSGIDRPDNPDPDVNPLAGKPTTPTSTKATPPAAVTPSAPVASVTTAPAPTLAPVAKDTTARTPTVSTLDVPRDSGSVKSENLPLPALATPEPEPEPTPLPVVSEPEPAVPSTPGRMVFTATKDPEAEALAPEPTPEPVVDPSPVAVVTPEPTPVPEPEPETVAVPEPVATSAPPAPAEVVALVPEPVATPEPVAANEAVATPVPTPAPVAVVPQAVKPAPAAAWVSVPGKLDGPVLGTVPVLAGLEKGKSYVQLGAWATEADVLNVLGTVKSYVPLALYKAEGEKNPWRVVVAGAPKNQLGMLLMHYRAQGFRTAGVVRG